MAELITQPELEPAQKPLVWLSERDAEAPLRASRPVPAGVGVDAAFSLAVYYYAIHSRLGPERVIPNVREAVSDAHQEDLDLGHAEHV